MNIVRMNMQDIKFKMITPVSKTTKSFTCYFWVKDLEIL